jgi:hypothetical protein
MATLSISDKLHKRLLDLAAKKQRPIDELLSEAIDIVDPQGDSVTFDSVPEQAEVEQLRAALQPVLAPFCADSLLTKLGIEALPEEDLDRALRELPAIAGSLADAVIQMREEERY